MRPRRWVRPGHRVFYGIAEEKEQRQVERSDLPDLALAALAHAHQHEQIDHRGPHRDVEQHVADAGTILCYYSPLGVGDAVTGTGALFGVLT